MVRKRSLIKGLGRCIVRLAAAEDGNFAIIFAGILMPLMFLAGMGIDYGLAASRQSQMNAYADAAALAAVTPTMMANSTALATVAAQNMFNSQASALAGVNFNPASLVVSVTSNGSVRMATVTYTATSQNSFAKILGVPVINIGGSSGATAGLAPNIDFYLLLDSSPSMGIAATQAGINTMVAQTQSQGGCAFACHETHPSADNLGNPNGEDNYALARSLGITLRIDMLVQAAQNLMTTAQNTESIYNASYRMALYTFDVQLNTIGALTANLTKARSQAGNIQQLTVYDNNSLTSSNNNGDADTNYDAAMKGINTIMPDPGSGTNNLGDTPQEVLFFVTDGVEDESVNGGRQQSLMDNGWCTTVKSRGIRIAVLYTTYRPLPTNGWYNSYVAPFQSSIGPTLEQCASPGLYFEVDTGGDISAAMSALFQLAVQSAYLSK